MQLKLNSNQEVNNLTKNSDVNIACKAAKFISTSTPVRSSIFFFDAAESQHIA